MREVLYFRLLSFLKRIVRGLVADFAIDKALLIRLCVALRLRAFVLKSSKSASSSSPTTSPAAYVVIPLQSSRGIIIAAVEVVLVVVLAYIELRRRYYE